ncbi:MAG TPA: hypothetical protein VKT31_12210 [Solirubrobacteraceae bacterium]|nr:hypothetical protein [Solirubrobacteraceae bacterium]
MTSYSLIYNPARLPARASAAGSSLIDRSRLRLLPSGDGWSLLGPDGELVFSAPGLSARRRCLEFAQAEGVLALVT